jgi:hypothetical protein
MIYRKMSMRRISHPTGPHQVPGHLHFDADALLRRPYDKCADLTPAGFDAERADLDGLHDAALEQTRHGAGVPLARKRPQEGGLPYWNGQE